MSSPSLTTDDRLVYTVSQLTQEVRDALQSHLSTVWVAGEITDLSRPRSGHVYLSLKDDHARLGAVIWRSAAERIKVPLSDGLQVLCQGEIDVYPPHGKYQLVIRRLEPMGEGELQRALRELRDRLAKEGLFDAARKRPLPAFPRRIAIVTSPSGAALHDFLQVAQRRWRLAELWIVPTSVQGTQATAEIVAAIRQANSLRPLPDVIVVTRGGGSMEDLWCFNEEPVVRAIHQSQTPVVSAIGHEIDVTLADLVADCRALTPSEAAERVIPSAEEWRSRLGQFGLRLQALSRNQLHQLRLRLTSLASRPVIARPMDRLRERAERLDELDRRLHLSMQVRLEQLRDRTRTAAARVDGLSPLAVLARGYSVTTRADSGRPILQAVELKAGDRIDTRLAEGIVSSIVESRRETP